MSEHFFEIVLQNSSPPLDGRDEVEDLLDEALSEAGVGEVTGGGSGMGVSTIDVDASDFDMALSIIRRVLQDLGAEPSTKINHYNESDHSRVVYPLLN